ncbi:MAG: hypothetical protein OM95_16200 [Bdellovibrio sp. ArHS]|uniref:Ig-like domain-containing protein n=1 Tax=Bdellovibrio sp. ArHS TaxID=1569284 RepID=UPI0005833B2A|nr:hypothetical protein [Bdellovibrio sp. ArHS]KHD87121.1 MAG: hypothetical protein OM95_16200 [Bdellovibrio sp. ArHS]
MKLLVLLLLGTILATPVHAQEAPDNSQSRDSTYEISLREPPEIDTQTVHYYYNFGRTALNRLKGVSFTLRNTGNLPLYFNDFDIHGSGFGYEENCPRLLFSGQRCTVRVFFRPTSLGTYSGALDIDMTGAEDIRIHLRGRGVWPY